MCGGGGGWEEGGLEDGEKFSIVTERIKVQDSIEGSILQCGGQIKW